MYFPQVHEKFMPKTRFFPHFIPCMVMISKVDCDDSSKLFWYEDQVYIRPYRLKGYLAQKMIKDDDVISLKDFSYLLPCCPSILIYRHGLHMVA